MEFGDYLAIYAAILSTVLAAHTLTTAIADRRGPILIAGGELWSNDKRYFRFRLINRSARKVRFRTIMAGAAYREGKEIWDASTSSPYVIDDIENETLKPCPQALWLEPNEDFEFWVSDQALKDHIEDSSETLGSDSVLRDKMIVFIEHSLSEKPLKRVFSIPVEEV